MKRLINIVLTIALLTATACEDFIEIEDRGTQDLDNYFATDSEAIGNWCKTLVMLC
jgi:hypothetical protein